MGDIMKMFVFLLMEVKYVVGDNIKYVVFENVDKVIIKVRVR